MKSILWLKFTRMKYEYYMYIIMMVMAIVLSFVFGNSFAGEGTQRVAAVVNNDGTEATEAFIDALGENAYSVTLDEKSAAENSVSKGDAIAALVIPEGFGAALKTGDAQLTIIKSADSADVTAFQAAVQNAASKAAHVYTLQGILSDTLAGAGISAPPAEDISSRYEELMGDNAAVKVNYSVSGSGYQERFATNVHYLMGFNIFFVTFSIVFTIGSILEDKKLKTWNRIRISPVSGTAVLAGNFIPAFIVGAVQMCIVLVLGQMMFGMDFGDRLPQILLVFASFVLTMTCFGLLLSALFNTYEQLNAGTPVILVATAMLGGCMWPLSIVGSDILLGIANAMPQKWALEAVENMAMGGSFNDAVMNILILLGMAVVFFAASVAIYNKKQRA